MFELISGTTHLKIKWVILGLFLISSTLIAGEIVNTSGVDVPGAGTLILWAFILGCFSAISLPLGALIGMSWKPNPRVTASMAAFGAGAMLAALTVELVAPTMLNMDGHGVNGDAWQVPVSMIIGSLAGGILFILLDQIVNRHGGYLRKTATAITYMSKRRKDRDRLMVDLLTHSDFLMSLDPEDVRVLIHALQPTAFHKGETLFDQGDSGDRMYFIEEGEIELFRDEKPLTTLSRGDILGEIAIITKAPRTAKAVAKHHVVAWMLTSEEFERLKAFSPELEEATRKITSERLEDLGRHDRKVKHEATEWAQATAQALQEEGATIPSADELRNASKEHAETPLAIWLGMVLDGIPESLVIGTTFFFMLRNVTGDVPITFGEMIPYTLIAGFFLSNFPEALSSSIGMRSQGWRRGKILTLWLSLMLMTALGSILGYLIGSDINHVIVVAIEGVAAGAMLTMIAQTMIPEAVHLGGPTIVGLSTLIGFLTAISFKFLEM